MPPCMGRVTRKSTRLPFGDKRHWFYVEELCGIECEGPLCIHCIHKYPDSKIQTSRFFDHGLVNKSYTEKSHLFESRWYLKRVKTFGEPTEEHRAIAMEAQKKARMKAGVTHVEALPDEPKKVPTKRILKKKTPEPTTIEKLPLVAYETADDPLPVKHVDLVCV